MPTISLHSGESVAALPREPDTASEVFLGWNKYPSLKRGFMCRIAPEDETLHAIFADSAYVIESHFRGDTADSVGRRSQFRRYVVDVYLANSDATSGRLALEVGGGFLYYLGFVPVEGVELAVKDVTDRRGGAYLEDAYFTTSKITLEWSSEAAVSSPRRPIARIMLAFGAWGMTYAELERRTSDDIITPVRGFAQADGVGIPVSANFYLGARPEELSEPVGPVREDFDRSRLLARFAVLADSHVGVRYEWENYDWLYGVYDHIERLHGERGLDFVVELGDNIDDGYAKTFERDYEIYLEEVKRLRICDAENPIENRRPGAVPHYELQGNHDTSDDTRFFKAKLWYNERDGHLTAHIAFFTGYGGYPAVAFGTAGDYTSYRSYGVLTDEAVEFVERSIVEARSHGAEQIVLYNHFGIAQDLIAPILPESGLGKLALICERYGIRLYFNGHEHNPDYTLRRFGALYDWDAAMTHDAYALVELYDAGVQVTVFDTKTNLPRRVDSISFGN